MDKREKLIAMAQEILPEWEKELEEIDDKLEKLFKKGGYEIQSTKIYKDLEEKYDEMDESVEAIKDLLARV